MGGEGQGVGGVGFAVLSARGPGYVLHLLVLPCLEQRGTAVMQCRWLEAWCSPDS